MDTATLLAVSTERSGFRPTFLIAKRSHILSCLPLFALTRAGIQPATPFRGPGRLNLPEPTYPRRFGLRSVLKEADGFIRVKAESAELLANGFKMSYFAPQPVFAGRQDLLPHRGAEKRQKRHAQAKLIP